MSKNIVKVGSDDKYEVLGVDWKEKHLGVPKWGWLGALLGAGYYFFGRKRR